MYVGFPFRRFTSAETLGHLSFAFRSSRPLNQVTQKSCSLSHACRWGPFPSLPQGHTHRTCTHSHTLRHTNTCAPYMLMHPHPHTHTHTHTHRDTLTHAHPTCSRTYIHTCTYTHTSHPHTFTWLCTLTCTHIPLHTNTCTPNPHIPLHTYMATHSSSHTRMHTPRDINTYVPYMLTHTHTPLVTCYALSHTHHNPQVGTLERSPSEGRTTH